MSKEVLKEFNLPNKPKFCEHIENGMKFNFEIRYVFEETLKEFIEKQDEEILKFLYEKYKDTDISKVYVLSKPEFEKFLLEMLPKWRREDDESDPRYKYSEDTLELFRICDEMAESKGVPPEPQTAHPKIITCGETYVWVNVDTLKDCINLLSTDGKGTKQQVKQKLEELLK